MVYGIEKKIKRQCWAEELTERELEERVANFKKPRREQKKRWRERKKNEAVLKQEPAELKEINAANLHRTIGSRSIGSGTFFLNLFIYITFNSVPLSGSGTFTTNFIP